MERWGDASRQFIINFRKTFSLNIPPQDKKLDGTGLLQRCQGLAGFIVENSCSAGEEDILVDRNDAGKFIRNYINGSFLSGNVFVRQVCIPSLVFEPVHLNDPE